MSEQNSKLFPEVRHKYLKRGEPQQFAVMCEGGGLPTVLHPTWGGAAFQAARLAHENPGARFHVLASQRVSFADPVAEAAPADHVAA